MNPEQHEVLVKNLAEIEAQLMSVDLTGVGCLHHDAIEQIVVGEHIARGYELRNGCGPWSSGRDYILGSLDRELDHLRNDPDGWMNTHKKYIHFDDMVMVNLETMERFYTMLVNLTASTEIPSCPSGIYHIDWDGFNIMVDKDDNSKVTAIIDWDYAQIRPIWLSEYDYNFSVFPNMTRDRSRKDELQKIRDEVFRKHAPVACELQEEHRHISKLAQAAWYRYYGDVDHIIQTARDLAAIWPKTHPGIIHIQEFLSAL
jgi:hypothetical protein